jgi:hypothetical protein
MAIVRPMEPRDIGPVLALMEDMAERSENLGSPFFDTVSTNRQNGFVETLKASMDNPEHSLLLVGEHKGEIVAALVAHLCRNYPYAKSLTDVFVPALWFRSKVNPIVAGRILVSGIKKLRDFSQNKECGTIFGNTYHADERARKLMRRMNFRATYIRYEVEVN